MTNIITVPHQGRELTFAIPAFGPSTYHEVGEHIDNAKLLRPTFSETVSLIHFAIKNPKAKDSNNILNVLDNSWFWAFNNVVEGQDSTLISDRNRKNVHIPSYNKTEDSSLQDLGLVRNLKNYSPVFIAGSIAGGVAGGLSTMQITGSAIGTIAGFYIAGLYVMLKESTPEKNRQRKERSLTELVKDPVTLALTEGEEGANKLADIKRVMGDEHISYDQSWRRQNSFRKILPARYGGSLSAGPVHLGGYAFGVLKENGKDNTRY